MQRVVAFLLLAQAAWSGEPASGRPSPALSKLSAGGTAKFQVKAGFRIELVAEAPLVEAPAAMAFDERGRLFVVEMSGPADSGENARSGLVRLLEDADETGRFHTGTVYADHLALPSAVACYRGGIFVAATPEILYLKDSKGNGIADVRQTVFSGFGGAGLPVNPDTLLNSLNWGMDNRIHGATAGIGGTVAAMADSDTQPLSLNGHDFSFNPRALTLVAESGTGASGLSFDTRGRKFLSDPDRPLKRPIYEPRYLVRNPSFPLPPEIVDAASPATPVYRFAAGAGSQPGVPRRIPARGLTTSWLAHARGTVVYRGSAFPSSYLDTVFIADPDAHIIHHCTLRDDGLATYADRPSDEEASEFLMSRDDSFRPAQLVNGPDGALYIADSGGATGGGRIYRIVPERFPGAAVRKLENASTPELVSALAQPNGWDRETAARLLFERQDRAAGPLLSNLLYRSRLPLARLHALHALEGIGALQEAQLVRALVDEDDRVREHAVLLAEGFARSSRVSETLAAQLGALAGDPAPSVRLQLALTLGELRLPGRVAVLQTILARDPDNPWMRAAVFSSLAEGAGQFLLLAASNPRFLNTPAGRDCLESLITMIGVKGRLDEVLPTLQALEANSLDLQTTFTWLAALGEGLRRNDSALALVDPHLGMAREYALALTASVRPSAALPLRCQALRLLGLAPDAYDLTADWLRALLSPVEAPPVGSAAIAALGQCPDSRIPGNLLQRWPLLTASLQREAVTALLGRANRAGALLDAIETGMVNPAILTSTHLNLLRSHRDSVVRQRALALFGPVPTASPALVEQCLPALALQGDISRGRDLFLARCASCHQLGGEGFALGPGLAGEKLKGKQHFLSAILEPNREIASGFSTSVVESKAGEYQVGVKTDENSSTFTLRKPGGQAAVWSLQAVASVQSQSWSLMPEGLAQGMDFQAMADLLDYIMFAPR